MTGDPPLLTATGLSKRFGALLVLDGVDLTIAAGEAIGIVGPNGAGKTTLLGVLSGAHPPSAGAVRFRGVDISRLPAAERCRRGIVRTHQIPRPFGGMTVFENVFVAASRAGAPMRQAEVYERCIDSLTVCGMLDIANRRAETVGLLDRKRLELARALATGPQLLLLDEIGGGLTDAEASELVAAIQELRRRGNHHRLDRAHRPRAAASRRAPDLHGWRTHHRRWPAARRDGGPPGDRRLSGGRCRMNVLAIDQLEVRHGLLRAVRQMSFTVAPGERLALVGANGAGKSTLLRAIAGAHLPAAGHVLLNGQDVTAMPANRRVAQAWRWCRRADGCSPA